MSEIKHLAINYKTAEDFKSSGIWNTGIADDGRA